MNYSKEARQLIKSQLQEWEMAATNYDGLKYVKTKTIQYNCFDLLVQYNPKRMTSSAAKVDAKSIEERPCFLCIQNLPKQQRGIAFKDNYQILVNPFPIFPEHLTIPKNEHTLQRIEGNFEDMLDLAEALDDFVIFYNGPKCGASAPDHFHFQAGNKGFLLIENDFAKKCKCVLEKKWNHVKIFHWTNYLRGTISFESDNKEELTKLFYSFYSHFKELQPNEDEPLMNILALYEEDRWIIHIFPRKLHRPSQFFEEGDKKILLSPASVDLGGVFITPREEDFLKINEADVKDILHQVSLNEEQMNDLIKNLISL